MVADSDGYNPQVALRIRHPIISIDWSPNGRQIAYTSFETGKPTVWIHDLSTGKRRQVAAFRGNNSAPAFSPDGGTLAVALSKDGGTKIYLLDTNGQNLRQFTTGGSIDTEPAFSPDGKYIYFTSDRGGNPQIYRSRLRAVPLNASALVMPTPLVRRSVLRMTRSLISFARAATLSSCSRI